MSTTTTTTIVTLTVAEQQKLASSSYINAPKKGRDGIDDITVDQLHQILSNHTVDTRCTFLAFHVTPNNDGKTFKTHLEMNDYNATIYEELSPETKIFVDNTITGKEQNQFKVAASGSKIGMFLSLLINKGSDEEPSWSRFDNIIVNISAGRFTIKNEFDSSVPKRVIVSVKNNNKMEEAYKPFLTNKKLDNIKLNECFKLLQEGFAFEMNRLKQCYIAYQKLDANAQSATSPVRFFDPEEINPEIFKASCLDGSDSGYASMYRRCKTIVTKENGKPVFEPVPYENEEDYSIQIRLPLSKELDRTGLDKYNKWTENIFNKTNIRVMAPFSQFNYRYINSDRIGNPEAKNSIMEYVVVPTLHRIKEYVIDNDRPAIHPYRQADVDMVGYKAINPMFTQFSRCNNQALNMVINFDCFVNTKNFVISAEVINFRPIYNVRLENKRTSFGLNSSDDGDNDIDESSYVPRNATKTRAQLKEAVMAGGEDIDEEDPIDLDKDVVVTESLPKVSLVAPIIIKEPDEVNIPKKTSRRILPKADNTE